MVESSEGARESLSALMDGEASEFEVRRLLDSLDEDPELRARWRRYQLARAALRRELPPRAVDLSQRVRDALEGAPAPRRTWGVSLAALGRAAVAASVAAVTVFAALHWRDGHRADPQVASSAAGAPRFQWPAGGAMPVLPARLASVERTPGPVRAAPPAAVPDPEAVRQSIEAATWLIHRHAALAAGAAAVQGPLPLARLPREAAH